MSNNVLTKNGWLTVTPSTGSGTQGVDVRIQANSVHEGRSPRYAELTWTADGVTPIKRTVIQEGRSDFVEFKSSNYTAPKEGKTILIEGRTNNQKLTFTLGVGDLNIELPATYNTCGMEVGNGEPIGGDRGAVEAFDFNFSIVVPANLELQAKTRQITVTPSKGEPSTCIITSDANDKYVQVPDGDITIAWNASLGKAISVYSNVTWTIS